MENRQLLKITEGIVYFYFKDESIVRCRCTANEEILKENGLSWADNSLYDLDIKKKIPVEYLEQKCEVFKKDKDEDRRSELDKFLSKFIKNLW